MGDTAKEDSCGIFHCAAAVADPFSIAVENLHVDLVSRIDTGNEDTEIEVALCPGQGLMGIEAVLQRRPFHRAC